ncbi:MAG: hypothetical protein A2089_14310 [Elusimicrobia bacterium GWD2_63_28]|nr:MAG: hypothetical protein A2089_14310 [Elusimicrobia bacterium GWD2_63_28]
MKTVIFIWAAGLFIQCSTPALAAPDLPGRFRISLQRTKSADDDRKYAIAFSPDNASLALGGINLDIWSTKGYLINNVLPASGRNAYGFALLLFSGDGKEVIAASKSEKTVNIFDAASGKLARTLTLGAEGNASCLALSPDGATLAIGTTEGYVELWSYKRHQLLRRLQVSDNNIGSLAFLRDGRRMVYGAADLYTIVRTPRSVSKTMNRGEVGFEAGIIEATGRKTKKFFWKNTAGAETLFFSPALEQIAIHDKKTLWLLDKDFKVLKTTSAVSSGQALEISRALISPDGSEIAVITGAARARMLVYSLPGLGRLADYDLGEHWEVNAAYTPDSRFIAIAGIRERNRLIDPHSGALHLGLYKASDSPVTADISPDGKSVVSGGASVGLWPIDGGEQRKIPSQFLSSRVILAPDGRHIVVGRRYGIEVSELDSGESRVFEAAQLSPVALSPDGNLVAYMPPYNASPDSMRLAVRNLASGKIVDEIPVRYCPVERVAFAGNGRFLVWGRGIYDLKLKKLVRALTTNVLDASGQFVAVAGHTNHVILNGIDGKAGAMTETSSRPTALRFQPGGENLAVGFDNGTIELRGLPGLQLVKKLTGHNQLVTDLEFSRDGRYLVSSSFDNTTKVWSLKNYSHYTRFSAGGEWLMYTSDGYFDASPRGEALAAMVRGTEVFSLEQFAARNNRPDIILGRMGLASPERLAHYKGRHLKRLKKLGLEEKDLSAELHAPEAKITATRREDKFLTVDFTLSDARFPLKSYNIYVNNVPLFTAYGRQLSGGSFSGTERIELTPGKNKIEVTATNAAGAEAYRAQAYADYAGKARGNLYYLAFGISKYQKPELALSYADKDAKDLEAVVAKMRPHYDNVFTKALLNSEATAANIKKARAFLANAGTDDTVVLFAAGHGGYDKSADPKYYYLPYEADPANLAKTGVQFEEIEAILDGIRPRKKLFLLDTCDSGELDEATFGRYYAAAAARKIIPRSYRKPLKKRAAQALPARPYLYEKNRLIYSDVSRRTGSIVFSSSRGGEVSYESALLQNGFFTSEVIAALSGRAADENRNARVSTKELLKYVSEAVTANTDNLQHPTVDRDNSYQEIEFPLP